MLCFELSFPMGRYHATPWGAHVNEGRVEWPPSPWRFVRALLSVGYTRLGWSDIPAVGVSLLEKMGRALPRYELPSVSLGHSRHYMPTTDNTTKVIDAFAYVGGSTLCVGYDGDYTTEERALAQELASRLPYLGRAEALTVARLREESEPPSFNCQPVSSGSDVGPADRVELLAPEAPPVFATWRARSLELAWQERLLQKAEEATKKGKKAPASLGKADQAKVASRFPSSWVDALGWDTSRLQRHGWDMPPGSRWVAYDISRTRARVQVDVPRRRSAERVDVALLTLSADARRSNILPPLRDVIRRTHLLHQTLSSRADPDKTGRAAPALTGRADGRPVHGHRHAYLLPLSIDCRKDRFDHVLLYASMGLTPDERSAIGSVRKTYAKKMPDLFVTLAGFGTREDFRSKVPELRSAAVWRSRTPFVPPRFEKPRGRNSLRGQIEEELEQRGLLGLIDVGIEIDGGQFVPLDAIEPGARLSHRFRHTHLERGGDEDRHWRAPPRRVTYSLELRFAEPVQGPIALGYGCHFGLGFFSPWEPRSPR